MPGKGRMVFRERYPRAHALPHPPRRRRSVSDVLASATRKDVSHAPRFDRLSHLLAQRLYDLGRASNHPLSRLRDSQITEVEDVEIDAHSVEEVAHVNGIDLLKTPRRPMLSTELNGPLDEIQGIPLSRMTDGAIRLGDRLARR